MMHANVVARNTTDPLCEAYSMLSGRMCEHKTIINTDCINDDGNFSFSSLPAGSYTLEVEEVVDDANNAGLAVAPGVLEELAGDAGFLTDSNQTTESYLSASTITLTGGETKDNVNITLDRSTVTSNRIQYIPLSIFTPSPGINCPEKPTTDYAALIGINEISVNNGSKSSLTPASGGCSLQP
jgi:hypothetical protein